MPEYLAPGVYVEEVSFRPKTIEGVSTSTAGFVGPARYGPVSGEPEILTSLAEFERIYGGLDPLQYNGTVRTNYLAQGVRAFFEEGGKRCYVARVFGGQPDVDQHFASATNTPTDAGFQLNVRARHPGRAGDMRVTFRPVLGQDVLVRDPISNQATVRGLVANDVVLLTGASQPDDLFCDVVSVEDTLRLRPRGAAGDGSGDIEVAALSVDNDEVRVARTDIAIEMPVERPQRPSERYASPLVLEELDLSPVNVYSVARHSADQSALDTPSRAIELTVPIIVELAGAGEPTGADWAAAIFGTDPDEVGEVVLRLDGGSDGDEPGGNDYRGTEGPIAEAPKSGLFALEELEDVSIVAAPGYSAASSGDAVRTIQAHLINHCESMQYRIAVLDTPRNQAISEVRAYRAQIDSTHAAMYYPWVTVLDPISQQELNLPPSGFVSGIYARNDVDFGVQKAPANEVVRLALRFERTLNHGQQEVLNPEGINCFRFFEGRGYRLWGARTATSDGEWKYVNLRRYFAYLERSIDEGTQVFVFESNGERLWANVQQTISAFLLNEWKSGRLMGTSADEAFFVRCDRTTMTQNDIDNGRLICQIGVAALRPAEFVIFRIGQKLIEMA